MAQMIGITGTHSTGKSTFFEKVRKQAERRGLRVERVGDVATRCQAAGFPILRDHTFESTLWIIASVISSELEFALKCDLILVDRPVSDAIGYLEAALASTYRTITEAERSGTIFTRSSECIHLATRCSSRQNSTKRSRWARAVISIKLSGQQPRSI